MSGIIGKNANRSSGVIGTVAAAGIASLAADSSPQLGGFLDAAGNYIQMEKGGDIASASPTVIDTDGDFFAVTGTTNFSAFTVAADRHFFLEFGGALTMTHGNGTLDLPGGANITTAASDVGEFISTAANVVTCVNYTKRDGTAVVAAASGVTAKWLLATHDMSVDETQSITGVGFEPGSMNLVMVKNATEGVFVGYSAGEASNLFGGIANFHESTADQWYASNQIAYVYTGSGAAARITAVAFTSDGVDLTWLKAGSPTGTAIMFFLFLK